MKAEIVNKLLRMLLPVRYTDGTTRYEWREVEGTEISLEGVSLKNGETLRLDYTAKTSG